MSPTTLLLVSAAAIATGLTVAVAVALGTRSPVTGVVRSLRLIEQTVQRRDVAANALPARQRFLTPFLNATRGLAERLSPSGTGERLTRLLDFAGNPTSWTVERLLAVKGAALLVFAAVAFLLAGGLSVTGVLVAAVAAAVGFFLPDLLVYNTGAKRQEQLRRGLADALDLLTVCVEAGLSLERALVKVATEIHIKSVILAQELQLVLMEMRAGFSKEKALRNFALRIGLDDIDSLVAMLIQSERFGTSIGDALRVYSDNLRGKRRVIAEEAAAKIGLKLLFPLIFCIFPTLLVVLLGPAGIKIMRTFSNVLTNAT